MSNKREWALALVPILASIGVLVFVVIRLSSSSETGPTADVPVNPEGRGASASQGGAEIAATPSPGQNEPLDFALSDLMPRRPEGDDVSRSHLIVVGRITSEIGKEFFAQLLEPSITPGPHEPERGVHTTKYAFEVERYVKGRSPNGTNTLTLQVLDGWPPVNLNERLLLLLVPWKEGTYQPGVWTTLTEHDGAVRFANRETVPEAEGMTLDQYGDRLAAVVEAQAGSGPPTPLAAVFPVPGESMTPAHFLALWMTESVQVTQPGKSSRTLTSADAVALATEGESPIRIEEATIPPTARTVRLTIHLEDGHVWEFEYDPSTGTAVYPPLDIQAKLPSEAQTIIARYLVE